MQTTTARSMPFRPTPFRLSWSVSTGLPWRNNTMKQSPEMNTSDKPSSTSMSSEEILMSL